MSTIQFHDKLDPRTRAFATELIGHVLRSCAPGALMDKRVGALDTERPTHVLAFGKASMGMSRWCTEQLGKHFAGGVVLAPESLIERIHPELASYAVDHPNPTKRNIDATNRLREYAEAIPAEHACVVCISGGGSAHLCSPRDGLTLDQIIHITKSMNESGATIHELNEARKQFETLKGGGLANTLVHVADRRVFVLSDVLDDDLSIIASGAMMSKRKQTEHIIIGNHTSALDAAGEICARPHTLISRVAGDATDQGRKIAESYLNAQTSVLAAGETTVDVSGSSGIGGPCMETALACAQRLAEADANGWLLLGLATDGIDGPTDASGAIITAGMIGKGATAALAKHDSLSYLDSIGAAFRTGSTGTNVNDLLVVIRWD